jgi:acyl carrier protein
VTTEPVGTDATSVVDALEAWLLSQARNADRTAIGPDVDLIDEEVIDSLGFINFLLLVEELRGAEIPADELKLESFRTLRRIATTFLERGATDG